MIKASDRKLSHALLILISSMACFCVGCERKSETPIGINPNVPRPVLDALGESLLPDYVMEKSNHIYRFTCLRSFNEPFCVVLTVTPDGAGSYVRKTATGADGHPGTLKEKTEGILTVSQVEMFLKLVDQERFWTLDRTDPPNSIGLDGSKWIVEGVRDGQYRIVSRWSPEAETPIGRIGRTLLQVTDTKIEHLY